MSFIGSFPQTRMRRLRQNSVLRSIASETSLTSSDLILPLFVKDDIAQPEAVASMEGVFRYGSDAIIKKAQEASDLGIQAIALFPVVDDVLKNKQATESYNPENLVCRTIRVLKKALPEMLIIGDVALDPYNSDGQDGVVEDGQVLNDETNVILAKQALALAKAGCDIVAPSDMMDGRVGVIRKALDEAGYENTVILSYGAKYASAFYGPFRDAVGSAGALGAMDKKTYQMDPANKKEAIAEVLLDIGEGADMVMVKPAMPYLDVIATVKEVSHVPVLAYQVSGEYAMIKAAAKIGAIDEKKAFLESIMAMKRAGASAILTYYACEIAHYLKEE